jgi:hypothetical protein
MAHDEYAAEPPPYPAEPAPDQTPPEPAPDQTPPAPVTDSTTPVLPATTRRRSLDGVRAVIAGWSAKAAAHPLAARARATAAARPRQMRLGLAGVALAVLLLVSFVSCSMVERTPGPAGSAADPALGGPVEPIRPSSSPSPVRITDGCHGIVTAAQVSRAAGFEVAGSGGDAAAAVSAYAEAIRGQGLDASIHLCPFASPGGDQLYVMAMTFPDAGQADRMYASGTEGQTGSKPLPGVGDAATTDGLHTLLARRGHSVVLVYLVRTTAQNSDQTGALRAVALAALAKA